MKKKDRNAIIIVALVIFAIFGASQLGFISTNGMTIMQEGYIDRTGSDSDFKLLNGTFNKSVSFDLSTSSKQYGDWNINIVDNLGREKRLWNGIQYQWICTDGGTGTQLETFRYSGKVQVFIEDSIVSIKEPLNNNNTLNFITYDTSFGGEPYTLKFTAARARGTRCNNRGISYANGVITISNVLLENHDPIIIEDPEPPVEEPGDPTDKIDEKNKTPYLMIFGIALLGLILWKKKKK